MRLTSEQATNWQLRASEKSPKPQRKKSVLLPPLLKIKRTEYPPRTRREKMLELRKLLPPLDLETDSLPGMWEPEILNKQFVISGGIPVEEGNIHADDTDEESGGDEEARWCKMNEVKNKCRVWLDNSNDE
jgi:hypothetical protein